MLPYFAIFIGIAILGGIFVFASRVSARQRIWFSLPNGNMVPIGGKFSGHIIISRTPHLITSVILRLEPSAEDRAPFIVKEMLSSPAKADEDLAIPFSLQIPDKLDDGSPIDGVRQRGGPHPYGEPSWLLHVEAHVGDDIISSGEILVLLDE